MCITKSLCCPIESSTTLETNYTSINTFKKIIKENIATISTYPGEKHSKQW